MNNLIRVVIPLLLGLAAGIVNFVVVRGLATPKELVAAASELKAGAEITNVNDGNQLVKFTVRTEHKELFKSAVPWERRGDLLHGRLTRDVTSGEAVLFTDVRAEGTDNIQSQLKPDEQSYTFRVLQSRIVTGLKIGDSVLIVNYDEGTDSEIRKPIGPYRVVGMTSSTVGSSSADEFRKISVAVPRSNDSELKKLFSQLESANARTHVEFLGKGAK